MVFAARQLQEKCQEQNAYLYSTYVDLTKAFNTVSREGLGESWWSTDAPESSSPSYDNYTMACWQESRTTETSNPFPISNGVKQGCVLAPTLFSLMFPAMLTDAFRDADVGIGIKEASSENQGLDRHHQRLPVRRWLCPQRYHRGWHATQRWQVLWCLQQLWPYHQHKEDWGNALASSRKAIHWTQHHHQQAVTEHGGQVHIPWQHTLQKQHHWWWSQRQTR